MKVALITNILTPYRSYFYDALFNEFDNKGIQFHVFVMTETGMNKKWFYNDLKRSYTTLMEGKKIWLKGQLLLYNPKVVRYLQEFNPDVLMMAGSYMFPTNWLVLHNKNKIKSSIIYWNEGHFKEARNYSQLVLNIREKVRKTIFKHFDGFFYSGKLAKEFMNHYESYKYEYFLPNLVDSDKYKMVYSFSSQYKCDIKQRYNIEDGKAVFIIPARLNIAKGLHVFIPLLQKCKKTANCVFLIAGNGDMEDQIKRLVEESCVDIRLLGFQNQKEIIDLYSISDGFILPSLSDPNPLTCIEALWCGLPLLVSEHVGNSPEVIDEGHNGYVFSYDDETAAIEIIDKFVNADQAWKQNAQEVSFGIANKMYNGDKVVKRIVSSLIDDFGKK